MAANTSSRPSHCGRALLALPHQRPLVVDDEVNELADRRSDRRAGRAERVAVAHDRAEIVRLALDVVAGGAERWNSITTTNASNNPNSEATTPIICDETSASNPSRVEGTNRRTAHTPSRTSPRTSPTTTMTRRAVGTVSTMVLTDASHHPTHDALRIYDASDGRLRENVVVQWSSGAHRADAAGASVSCFVMFAAGSRYETADIEASPTSPSTCSSRARSGGRPHATSRPRSTGSAASSTRSRARSTPATTSSAPPARATWRSTSSST